MNKLSTHVVRFLLLTAALLASTLAGAQSSAPFPSRPIRWIVDFPAGGISDILARLVGQKLSEAWGVPVVVDNKPGANGIIANSATAMAAPDGYTIGLVSTPLAINSALRKDLPFDARKNLIPVALLATTPNVLIANTQLGVKTLQGLVDSARGHPGGLNYASVGVGSSPHISAEMLKKATGLKATHVPYKGSGQALLDLIEGRSDFMFVNLPSALPHIRAGKVVVLGVADDKRNPVVPDAPTLIEAGLPEFISIGWYGAVAPAGVSMEIVQRFNTEINRILQLPDVREKIISLGAEPGALGLADFTAFVDRDMQRWARAVHDTGVTISN